MRLFIATWPPTDIIEQLSMLPRDDTMRARWTRPEQWHVTLRFVGKVRDGELAPLTEAIDRAAGATPPPVAVLGPATECFGRHILHAPVAGLEPLAQSIVAATAAFGVAPRDEPFNGHVTLARTRRSRGGRPRGADLRALAGVEIAGRWTVNEICLVRSHRGPGGSRYEVVHEATVGTS